MLLRAKKSLGQHFLTSTKVLSQIIEAGNIKKGDKVLEIGPGTGVLTRELLKSDAKVIAVEKDIRAYELLQGTFAEYIQNGQLTLIYGDILDTKLLSGPEISSLGTFSLIANIPYYITGAILEQFLEYGPRPEKMVLLVQKEVADRICAPTQSVLSASIKLFGTPSIHAKVPRGAFNPPPTVESAILVIENISLDRAQSLVDTSPEGIQYFFKVIRAGFAHKRKFAKRNLEIVMSPDTIDEAWKIVGLNDKERAENISIDQWIRVATHGLSKG